MIIILFIILILGLSVYIINNNSDKPNINKNPEKITIPREITYNNFIFNYIGQGINDLYHQKYYLYERKNDQYGNLLVRDNLEYLDNQIYTYLFINEDLSIQYEFGPRPKINVNDIIYLDIKYLSNGISHIGPYIIQ